MREEHNEWLGLGGLVIAIIAATIWTFGDLPSTVQQIGPALREGDYAPVAGAIAGGSIFVSVVVFAILYALFLRSASFARGMTYFLIIFAVSAAVQGGVLGFLKFGSDQQVAQYRQANAEMRKIFSLRTSGSVNVAKFPVTATGDAGVLETIFKNEVTQSQRVRESYRSEMKALTLSDALSPAALATDRGIANATATIEKARATVKIYLAEETQTRANARAAMASSQIDLAEKKLALATFDDTTNRLMPLFEKNMNCHDEILVEYEKMVRDLANTAAPWRARGKIILFSNKQDLEIYQSHLRKVDQLKQEERTLVAQLNAVTASRLQMVPAD
jgi:voltage-gated potassium channel Kch